MTDKKNRILPNKAVAIGIASIAMLGATPAFAESACDTGDWREGPNSDRVSARVIVENHTDEQWYGREFDASETKELTKAGTRLWRNDWSRAGEVTKRFRMQPVGSDIRGVHCEATFDRRIVSSGSGRGDISIEMRLVSAGCDAGENKVSMRCTKNWNPDRGRMTVHFEIREPITG